MAKAGKRAAVGRAARRAAGALVRLIAALVALCVCCVALVGCVLAGNLITDALRERGGSFYEQIGADIENLGRSVLARIEGEGASDAAKRDYIRAQLRELADAQAATDAQLLAELDSGAYGLESPFVLVNPYGISPLTAILLFETPEPARISIHIAGDSPAAEVDFEFSAYETRHLIPVYGLYAGRTNEVTVTAVGRDGAMRSATIGIRTDPQPAALAEQRVEARAIDAAAYQPGFTFTYRSNRPSFKSAIDIDGAFRWYLDTSRGLLAYAGYCGNYNGGESVFISCGDLNGNVSAVLELNFLGKLLNAWYVPSGIHHDISFDGEGSMLLTGSRDGAFESLILRLDMASGEITGEIDYADVLQVLRNQSRRYGSASYYSLKDWCHINTVLDLEGDLLISSRHQSTVMRNDWDGNIKWMLCDPADYYESYRQYILTPVGADFSYPCCQHAPEILPDQDGNPDTLDILLFDNGDYHAPAGQRASRLVQYRIDERAMTVEQVWSWGGDRPLLYSSRHGDADLLANGNRLGSFEHFNGADARNAYGVELDADGRAVWEMWRMNEDGTNDLSEYRLERLEIYADSANDLHVGEPARLFLPEE